MISTKETAEDEIQTRKFGGLLLLVNYTKKVKPLEYRLLVQYICNGKSTRYNEIFEHLVDRIQAREDLLVKYLHNYRDLLDLIFPVETSSQLSRSPSRSS